MTIEWCQVCGSSVWTGQPCGKCVHDGVVATRDDEIARLKAEVEAERFDTRILRRNLDQARDDHDAEAARLRLALAAGPAALRDLRDQPKRLWVMYGLTEEQSKQTLPSLALIVEAAQAAAMKEGM